MSVLADLLARAERERDQKPVFIFDLDSTLFSTQQRNHAILREFIERIGAPADFQAIAVRLTSAEMGWNVIDDLRYRLRANVGPQIFDHIARLTRERLVHDRDRADPPLRLLDRLLRFR